MTNNTSTVTTVVTAASVPGIPSASEWGLMLMAAFLACAGLLTMRGRM